MERSAEVQELVALIDRLESLLERSSLSELEVAVGETALVLRRPSALHAPVATPAEARPAAPSPAARAGGPATEPADAPGFHAVLAPLTGVFYRSPSPGAGAYVRVGAPVGVGQVIGLIEAMKLFNEIKSDVSGVVRRVTAEDGALVKARQPLIEVEPS